MIDSMAKLIVITVVRNDSVNLEKTRKSLVNSRSDVCWLIKNGGNNFSDDVKVKLMKTMPNVMISQSPDDGIYNAMNEAATILRNSNIFAKKDWVWFLNAGDVVDNLETLIAEFTPIPDHVQALLLCVKTSTGAFLDSNKVLQVDYQNVSQNRFKVCHQALLMRKDSLMEVLPFSEEYEFSSDFDLILRFLLKSPEVRKLKSRIVWDEYGYSSQNLQRVEWEKLKILFTHLFRYRRRHTILAFMNVFHLILRRALVEIIQSRILRR